MSDRGKYVLWASLSLLLGGLCYIFLRPDTHVARLFFVDVRIILSDGLICEILRFYFPDFCWGFALCLYLMAIYTPKTLGAIICAAVGSGCGCVWELLQYCRIVQGTGDLIDTAVYLTAGLLAIIINRKVRKRT